MLVDFKTLPETSRVWIYQCNRSFSDVEITEISSDLDAFLTSWTAHGNDLNAGYEIKYKRFIIIALDQSTQGATGCSIDASVRFIQELERKYNVMLLDKMNVSYKQGEFVAYKSLLDFKAMAKQKAISKNTIVFNNLVANKGEYLEHWEVPASESWHARFL
ncbi:MULTISPECIES: ABC transporter ATPase [Maribacter]|uniref:ABC transporter ATPase n=1 Tax=Maribacter dokdonensis TaxID=320912 RepID=A0A1H4QC04_9FLAO|nr:MULTISPECIES: ABC transporter ATPase [Maribacter]HAF78354.1 ABC transporter ATPase [Maribacter sp.]APA65478.1 ABC transporter ATPase [Maribacter sp. 1_2014MBL_MicDiv]MBU2901511.1 ABC transporter ATPase [Maribacter dokdonensis]PHN93326.1 ABC transporter ATPase [Maribacter sp. 6B07]CAG2535311.1 bacterial condensin subunit MukF [Maribacter dokdonensis]